MGNATTKKARHEKVIGMVSSAAGDKTIRVVMNEVVKHPTYGKYIRRRTKLAAHDEKNAAQKGDTVEIVACRRISKTKAFRLLRIVKRGGLAAQAKAESRAQQ
jgi:small subunit ribosomal protein S17